MRLVAGVDVGNSTTEVVLADVSQRPPRPVGCDRAPTRGEKGSPGAAAAAVGLVRRLHRRVAPDAPLTGALVAPQVPARQLAVPLERRVRSRGRLRSLPVGGTTPGTTGVGAGAPWQLGAGSPPGGPLVVVVPAELSFASAAAQVDALAEGGAEVRAVVLEADEGVLVAHRLRTQVPVVDQVDASLLAGAEVVAVEVVPAGEEVAQLGDPLRLLRLLGLGSADGADAAEVARDVAGRRAAVVVRVDRADPAQLEARSGLRLRGGRFVGLGEAAADPPAPGDLAAFVPPSGPDLPVADIAVADVAALLVEVHGGRTTLPWPAGGPDRPAAVFAVAALRAAVEPEAVGASPTDVLADGLGVPVDVPCSELDAALAGARSTPASSASAAVLDVGGGTVDAMTADGGRAVTAGAGEHLTAVVATLLGLPRGAADWVKRGPAARAEAPQLLLDEDGTRRFLERPLPVGTTGSLVCPGPAGALPFAADLAPAQWRLLRLAAKRVTVARAATRAWSAAVLAEEAPRDLLLVGGAAADQELRQVLARAWPASVVATADVAGELGHRYAVAYGLVLRGCG